MHFVAKKKKKIELTRSISTMTNTKLRLIGQNQFIKTELDIFKQLINQNIDQIKKSLLTSKLFCEDGESNILSVQSRLHAFFKEMFEWIKKHKKIGKNLHYAKEVENADIQSIYEVFKHKHTKPGSGFEIILNHYHSNKHYEILKQFNFFNLEMFILVYTYSLMLYIMCIFILYLFFLLYF